MEKKEIDEITKDLELHAKKLAILLHNSTMPDDVKLAWISLLPEMSAEQIGRLLNILEAKYLDEQTRDIDEKYKKELEEIVKGFENEKDENHKKLIERINQLA